jgi:hypothetical protein
MTDQTQEQAREGLKELLDKSRQERLDRLRLGQSRRGLLPDIGKEIELFKKRFYDMIVPSIRLTGEIYAELTNITEGTDFYPDMHFAGTFNPSDRNLNLGSRNKVEDLVTLSFPVGVTAPLEIKKYSQGYRREDDSKIALLGKDDRVRILMRKFIPNEHNSLPHEYKSPHSLELQIYLNYNAYPEHLNLERGLPYSSAQGQQELLGSLDSISFESFMKYLSERQQRLKEAERAFENVGVGMTSSTEKARLTFSDFLKNGRDVYFGLVEKAIRDYKIK